MSRLVDDILYLSKFETKELDEREVDISDVIYESSNNISVGNNKDISFKIDLDDDLKIIGDEELIEKVFDNIISNAYRYAETTIKISGFKSENMIKIDIVGDGNGIELTEIEHIF